MRQALLAVCVLLAMLQGSVAEGQTVGPFEAGAWSIPATEIDGLVAAALAAEGLEPAGPCSDEVFLRRTHLDVTGKLPDPAEVPAFLQNPDPGKRAAVIEGLLQSEAFADYWTLKWGDLLRVKAEFPINLWPNATQAYHRWIRDAVRQNRPYDQVARELLTASGSNFRVPPVNFWRAVQGRTPAALAEAVALTFMGARLGGWPQEQRDALAGFFSRVAYKKTGEWKEEIIAPDLNQTTALEVTFPDGTRASVEAGDDPRVAFADWLVRPGNPWFARSLANRVWSWLLGRGIIHETDDLRPDNPPANPELLAYLEQELVAAKFDPRHLYRLILNSRTYQQSCVPRSHGERAEALCAYYPMRRLDAEVLADALHWIGGTHEDYVSPIPEPFTYIPQEQGAVALPDGSITSAFLQLFGRPARDTGLESERSSQPTDAQRLYLLNSSEVQRQITRSPRLRAVVAAAGGDPVRAIQGTYLMLLSRYPTEAEVAAGEAYLKTPGLGPGEALADLAWALINTAEFLYRH